MVDEMNIHLTRLIFLMAFGFHTHPDGTSSVICQKSKVISLLSLDVVKLNFLLYFFIIFLSDVFILEYIKGIEGV